ncbi:MAG: hypothetical protein R3E83_11190 [Burkholderiaceae bacterium]
MLGLPGASAQALADLLDDRHPLTVDADTLAASGALPGFVATGLDDAHLAYLERIVDPATGFEARRESIDEFGWRNFGELVADHEAVRHDGEQPFITHYNNQYDFVLGAALHGLRTGDVRWWRLHLQAARHLVDIDVYHTDGDRPLYNHGMFWHTDHYLPAATATHRTYSRANARAGSHGGGPSDEHCYDSGLLVHYWLTGDEDSRETVLGLADWVIAVDDGANTIWSLFDRGPTGFASMTVDPGYHGPGRGAGNSILALLNAWQLQGRRRDMAKAEALIRRCIHPRDDLAARELDQPEHRWSYLVFLQVLAQYLWLKECAREYDGMFHYARESLLHYARWMAEHERPYAEQLHKVELPTETWPAQDVRKPHVLMAAARYAVGDERARLLAAAESLHGRYLADLLRFETCGLTRPLVLLAVFSGWTPWYRQLAAQPERALAREGLAHVHDFGEPEVFVPQSQRARQAVRQGLRTLWSECRRLLADRLAARGRR